MTPEQIRLVTESIEGLRPHADQVASRFYTALFEIVPEARELFPDDMTAQRAKLFNELDEIAHAIPDLDAFVARATALGKNHIGYGVRAEHYRAFGHALLVALPDCIGAEWNDALADAWRLAYHLVADSMQRASLV